MIKARINRFLFYLLNQLAAALRVRMLLLGPADAALYVNGDGQVGLVMPHVFAPQYRYQMRFVGTWLWLTSDKAVPVMALVEEAYRKSEGATFEDIVVSTTSGISQN